MKYETSGAAIVKLVGLKAKMYLLNDSSENKKAKGVNKMLLQE